MPTEARKPGKGASGMLGTPTVIMGLLAVVLFVLAYRQGDVAHWSGLKSAGVMMLQILPLLIFAFIVAAMIQLLVPSQLISRWIGAESGWRGLMIGAALGGIVPGGPYAALPIAAGLVRTGAGLATCVAFLAGWALWSIPRLPMEFGVLGWKLTMARYAATFVFPPIAGLIAHVLFRNVKL